VKPPRRTPNSPRLTGPAPAALTTHGIWKAFRHLIAMQIIHIMLGRPHFRHACTFAHAWRAASASLPKPSAGGRVASAIIGRESRSAGASCETCAPMWKRTRPTH